MFFGTSITVYVTLTLPLPLPFFATVDTATLPSGTCNSCATVATKAAWKDASEAWATVTPFTFWITWRGRKNKRGWERGMGHI